MSPTPPLEVFCPAELAGQPVFMVLPGGAYLHRADHEGAPVARWLNSVGLNAIVVHYPIAPERAHQILHPAPLTGVRRTLQWLRSGESGLSIDTTRIGVLGFSAGGHLAATLSTGAGETETTDRPDLTVLAYPVISLVSHAHQGSVDALLGPDSSRATRHLLSAEVCADASTPPTFLWHTADDDAVPVENSLSFASALARNDVPFEMHIFPHGRHGLGLATDEEEVAQHSAAGWAELCSTWLTRQGWHPSV
ncbi:alpha/beta hydrolase [Arthrobacter psychrolactophilus]|uniref:Alpha/beta hydrolase n=1 Tax=Arthrobacter psychrolactophilus TaxID=92442 RepID=A0A2V5IXK2_9MICC|nr:alpha/beta hydrolase [Arthrobacter psychrolactophilus]PYI39033.1 alpha/beta hydrolase [Arthrobacter psychrolactophilus]